MAGTPASTVWMQRNHSSWPLEEPSTVQNANLSDTVTGYADLASPVDGFNSIFPENMPVVEDISSQALQNNTPPPVFAAAPRNLASFEQEGFNQDVAGVANEGKAEKLCVKQQGRRRSPVYTTNRDIMSQLKKMQRQTEYQLNEVITENEKFKKKLEEMQNRLIKMDSKLNEVITENEKLKKEVEEMQNRLIKMDSKQNHIVKNLKICWSRFKQVAVCNNKAHSCSAE